jgi:hypothetical protein
VAVCLCAAIRATAGDLLGWQEAFPRNTSKTTVNLADPALVPGPDRRKFLADEGKLTSDETDGHMMFLGEYYAMYLMTWSQELWPRVPSGQDAGSLTLPSVGDVLPQTASDATMAKAVEERTRALQFARSIQRARRVLANIPTYMICDDHDVTDDWFLHRQWEADSRTNPVTRRIMRNALIAYAIFQAWGNNPTYFTRTKGTTPPQKLFEAVTINLPATAPPIQSSPDVLDVPLDLKADGRLPDGSPDRIYWGWGFKGTGHQVIALDTRTRRQFPASPAPPKANVGLMTAGAMADLATSATNFSGITIILSPAPVFGNPRAELLIRQRIKNAKPGVPAEEQNDNETWIGNRPVFEQFLRVLAPFQRVVILSGDVHYGFSNQVAYFQNSPPPPLAARFVHLCSSAFHNESSLTKMSGSGGYTPMFGGPQLVLMGWLGFDKDLSAVFNDVNAKLKPHFMLYSSIPVDQAILMSMLNVEGAERFKRPAVVPTNGWATDDAVSEIQSLLKAPNGPPGWQYQVRYLTDERDQATQIAAVNGLQAYSQPPKDSSQEQLFRTLVFDKARAIVGNNNFGHVTFQSQASQISGLVHKLYRAAQAPDGSDVLTVGSGTGIREVWTFTQHQASLTVPTISERPVVTK